jgi:hypothetical protein
MIGAYMKVRNRLQEGKTTLSLSNVMIAGTIGGWVSVIVVTPIEQIKARLQVRSDSKIEA